MFSEMLLGAAIGLALLAVIFYVFISKGRKNEQAQ